MIPDSEAFVIHDGLTSLVRLTIDWHRLIPLAVIGPDDKEEGQIVLSVQADGYELNVRTTRSQQCLPFLTWPNTGKRVRDILPRYRDQLSPQAYRVLDDEDVGNLLVREFRRLLRKAIQSDNDPRPERRKQGWNKKLSNANLHSSPLYVDGLLYCPMMEGKLVVVKPGASDAEIVQEIKLDGGNSAQCLGAPVVCDGTLYVTTTEKFYAFPIPNSGIKVDLAPVAEIPAAGKAVSLQIIPAETVIMRGNNQAFRIRSVEANGMVVSDKVEGVKWESFIPPTAKVKATMDASFNDPGELVVAPDAKISAGAWKATSADGLSGTIRGRGLKGLPITEDFEGYTLTEEFPADPANPAYKFAYPPLGTLIRE